MRNVLSSLCFLFVFLPTLAHATFEPKVEKKVLANGATVLVLPVPGSQVVSVQVWYHVGSKNEEVGKRGLAHMFEHLMFKGTRNIGPEEHARRINAVGGSINAFTTEDVTAYHEVVPREQMDLALKLEADRMTNLLVTDKNFSSEREVVKEEKRLRYDNSPIGATLLELRNRAYTKHPYKWTPIGTIEDLDGLTVTDAKAFYKKWYEPGNATIVIVGGVDPAKAFAAAEKHFAKIPKAPEPDRTMPVEPEQKQMRSFEVRRPAQVPVLIGGYHTPRLRDEDMPALEVLASILSEGESSRLNQVLVKEKKLCLAAGGFNWTLEDPGLFAIYAVYLPDTPAKVVEKTLLAEVENVALGGVSDRELQKAKNQLTASYIFGLDTASGLADQLASAEVLEGDYHEFLKGASKYEKVTSADVKRVAAKYLKRENLTLVTLIPDHEG